MRIAIERWMVVAVAAAFGSVGCEAPVTGSACLPGEWQSFPMGCHCGSPENPASALCVSPSCELRNLYVFRDGGRFLTAKLHIDEHAFSTLRSSEPTEGAWSADEATLMLQHDPPSEFEKSYEYTCEGDELRGILGKFDRLDGEFAAAIRDAVADGTWVNHAY